MTRPELRVGGISPLTTIDYPGELAAVVFCQGCPWRCHYCHNPELLPARGSASIAWGRVMDFLQRRRGLLDAVVFSGGEPTLQPALAQAMAQVRELGFRIGLHTAGVYPRRLRGLFPLLDWVGLDIKALPDRYSEITQVRQSGEAAWRSAEILAASGVAHEVRITRYQAVIDAGHLATLQQKLEELGVEEIRVQPCQGPSSPDCFIRKPGIQRMGPASVEGLVPQQPEQ